MLKYTVTHFKTLLEFLLLLVNDPKSEVNFVRLLKIWLHSHHLGKGFLGVFQGAVPIVEDADPVP